MRAELDSSAIKSIAYNEETQLLSVEFRSGGIYDYPSVPKDKVVGLLEAESAGKYFHKNIRQYSVNA
jgi:hypothetical protein